MALDWSKPVRTQHKRPLIGYLMEARGFAGQRRIAMPSMSAYEPTKSATVYLYSEDGVSRVDGAASEFDLVNFDRAEMDSADFNGLGLHGDALQALR